MPDSKTKKTQTNKPSKIADRKVGKIAGSKASKKTLARKQVKKLAPAGKKGHNAQSMNTTKTTNNFTNTFSGYGEPARKAITLEFKDGYSLDIWTGSKSHDWREIDGSVDWVFGPDGVVTFTLPTKPCGIALFDKMHKPSPLVVALNMPDMQRPNVPVEFWAELCNTIVEHKPRRILLMCFAGRGRTGIMLSCIYGLFVQHGYDNVVDYIEHIRSLGCEEFVETREQAKYVAEVLGLNAEDVDEKFKGKHVQQTSTFAPFNKGANGGFYSSDSFEDFPPVQQNNNTDKSIIKTNSALEDNAHRLLKEKEFRASIARKAVKNMDLHRLVNAAEKLDARQAITLQWFDMNSGTAKMPENEARMYYVLIREFPDAFMMALADENTPADVFTRIQRVVENKTWQ